MKKNLMKAGIIGIASLVIIAGCTSKEPDTAAPTTPTETPNTVSEPASNQTPWVATKNTTRINTNDPTEAAVLVSQTLWTSTNEQNRPGAVILVNPDDWPIAAVSANLVHFPNNGPLLFTGKNEIPEITLNEIKRLNPTGAQENQGIQVILVGEFDNQVQEQLETLGFKTDHLQASSPADYGKVIDTYYAKAANEIPQSVVIGSMDSPEFTLPAVKWISHMSEPLLLVSKDEVPQETVDALQTRNGKANIYLLGPDTVVSSAVEEQLKQYGKVTRISGNDAYENAIAFAQFKDSETQFGWGITKPGHNLSFIPSGSAGLALAAAPFSHLGKHAPMLWTDNDKMPASVMDYVMSIQPKFELTPSDGPFNHAWLTGAIESFTFDAQAEIDDMLEIVSATGEGHGGHGAGGGNQAEGTDKKGQPADHNKHH
ncbi:cell wall-binding repeat-containing protein [Ammoniphilus sp. YIM 78166]|uniref:cell wall-binding repeat-containing protein n=1 Tax=Ammoniphilus sp. YIM 78166 TaxID=1644106 RepID=UPI00196A8C6E|nr:cell wall-binding repeat-containing protein [Ammoniphilus sp. YIM 78166]